MYCVVVRAVAIAIAAAFSVSVAAFIRSSIVGPCCDRHCLEGCQTFYLLLRCRGLTYFGWCRSCCRLEVITGHALHVDPRKSWLTVTSHSGAPCQVVGLKFSQTITSPIPSAALLPASRRWLPSTLSRVVASLYETTRTSLRTYVHLPFFSEN